MSYFIYQYSTMQKLLLSLVSLILLSFTLPQVIEAQKVLKPIRTFLKARNYGEAAKKVAELEKDSIANKLAELYVYGAEANIGLNDVLNEKIYLKQSYDTVQFFSTTRAVLEYAVKAWECEAKAEGEVKGKLRKNCEAWILRYYPNLNAAGRFLFTKQKYEEAMPYFRLFLELPKMELGKNVAQAASTSTYRTNAYLYLRSAFKIQNYQEAKRYKDLVLTDTSVTRRNALESLALIAEAEGDTVAFHNYLEKGWELYPSFSFFFTRLADYYTARGRYAHVMRMADRRLTIDSVDIYAHVAKTMVYVQQERYAEAIDMAQRTLQIDSTQTEMYLVVGTAYCNRAAAVGLPDDITSKAYQLALKEQKQFYREAMPYMEAYRQLNPANRNHWAPLLYRIYLSLNEGEKFEKISKEMQTLEYIKDVRKQ